MAWASSEDSDQPGHRPSLIRVFAVHLKKARILSYPLSAQQRLWSDWANAQADLSLRWAHMPFCWFCHDAAQMYLQILDKRQFSPSSFVLWLTCYNDISYCRRCFRWQLSASREIFEIYVQGSCIQNYTVKQYSKKKNKFKKKRIWG